LCGPFPLSPFPFPLSPFPFQAINGAALTAWSARCLAFDYAHEVAQVAFAKAPKGTPAFSPMGPTLYKGTFAVDAPADTCVLSGSHQTL